MAEKITFPKISANIEEATLTYWVKTKGDVVAKGDIIAEITTDKGVVEFESPAAGTLLCQAAPENSTIPVGYIIAIIGKPGEEPPSVDAENRRIIEEHRAGLEEDDMPQRHVRKAKRQRVRATPAARRLARRNDIELSEVKEALGIEVIDEASIQRYLEDQEA